ncbi:MAG: hypothetical protein MMC33_009834 [Icmadophila ericetorum]|nr:hypothetical protein [Icmadophila ericetorum]
MDGALAIQQLEEEKADDVENGDGHAVKEGIEGGDAGQAGGGTPRDDRTIKEEPSP